MINSLSVGKHKKSAAEHKNVFFVHYMFSIRLVNGPTS